MIAEAAEAKQRVAMLEEQEKHLRTQVAIYTEKFEDFQDTLTKSHEAFQSYKVEAEQVKPSTYV